MLRACQVGPCETRQGYGVTATVLTAVIEFLSAFTLFLMILTAFLALAQMQMGSNDPYLDRLDRSAVLGLDRLVADEGWFVPVVDGEADVKRTAHTAAR
ncbi:MAG: hypothetical protein CM15mP128_1000 [Methanobacteriota archaeon]|nr:MAG: hypothetical protein CM15mP128_1000 [Euryarchaeota archaeon]